MRRVAAAACLALFVSPALADDQSAHCARHAADPEARALAWAMAEMMNVGFDGSPLNADLADAFALLRAGRTEEARLVVEAIGIVPAEERDRYKRRAAWAARIMAMTALRCGEAGAVPPAPHRGVLAVCVTEQRRLGNPMPGEFCGCPHADELMGFPERAAQTVAVEVPKRRGKRQG